MDKDTIEALLNVLERINYNIHLNTRHKKVWEIILNEKDQVYYYKNNKITFNENIHPNEIVYTNVRDVFDAFSEKISDQKDIPDEYIKLVNKYFWDLV